MGAAQGCVVIGLLAARSLAGVVTDIAGWRLIYLVSCALAIAMLVALSRLLPDTDVPRERIGYAALPGSIVTLCAPNARGAIASTMRYARAGWTGVCALGATVSWGAFAVWVATRRRA